MLIIRRFKLKRKKDLHILLLKNDEILLRAKTKVMANQVENG